MALLRNPALARRYVPKHNKNEQSVQLAVCHYLDVCYPHVMYKSDYGSGLGMTQNQARLQARMQSGPGWPDMFLPVPVHHSNGKHYCGLYIELKADGATVVLKNGPRKGKLTTDAHIQKQAAVLQQLNHNGYYANFAVGYDAAINVIDWYFDKPQNAALF